MQPWKCGEMNGTAGRCCDGLIVYRYLLQETGRGCDSSGEIGKAKLLDIDVDIDKVMNAGWLPTLKWPVAFIPRLHRTATTTAAIAGPKSLQ